MYWKETMMRNRGERRAEAAPGLHAQDVCTGVSVLQPLEYRHLLLWIVVRRVDDGHL